MADWTDPNPSAFITHIRFVHMKELRTTVDRNRSNAGLGAYPWTDPVLNSATRFKAAHFLDVRSAIQQYTGITLSDWQYGSPPVAFVLGRPVSVRDLIDLRNWTNQFSVARGFPTGPAPDPQGISSFTFAPRSVPQAIADDTWVADVIALETQQVPLIRLRAQIYDNPANYDGYQLAFQTYTRHNVSPYALL